MVDHDDIFSRLSDDRYRGIYAMLARQRGVSRQAVRDAAMRECVKRAPKAPTLSALKKLMAQRDHELELAASARAQRATQVSKKRKGRAR